MINYILFIATAILLFLVFRVIRLVSHRLKGLYKFYPILIALELSLWMAFLFWLIHYFFQYKSYYKDLVLVLVVTSVILLVWFYIKDVIAGFLFRIKHNPRTGQLLFSSEADGIIKSMAPSQIFVEREGGELLRIPYSKLFGNSLSIKTADASSASEVILFLPSTVKGDQVELEKRIRLILLQSPWCVPTKPIKIDFVYGDKEGIEISLHLVNKSFAEAAKVRLTQLVNG